MADLPDIPRLDAADTPWGVPVLDVRPVTQHMLSTSTDPQMARNAISYGGDDGRAFADQQPASARTVDASLAFAIDRVLADGVLFTPLEMEDKWALFVVDGRILFVRSWLREVYAVADVRIDGDVAVVGPIRGSLAGGGDDEPPALTVALVDFLLQSHALHLVSPVPLRRGLWDDPRAAAMWCMSMFGRQALFATEHAVERRRPAVPLRSHSRLHIALARGELAEAERALAEGLPVDLRAGDGLTTLHWALTTEGTEAMAWLLARGCPVDARSDEGATPLMNAVQMRLPEKLRWLLDHGADPDAADHRGFTALHRAAEMGEAQIVSLLLERGATAGVEAAGHTPRSLAEGRQQHEIAALLREHGG